MALIIRADNRIEKIESELTLENMQEIVGGYIEIIPLSEKQVMIINEEGKLQGLEKNSYATVIVWGLKDFNDIIVGDVIIADQEEVQ